MSLRKQRSSEIALRPYEVPISSAAQMATVNIINNVRAQRAAMQAIETVANSAMHDVVAIKKTQMDLELMVPAASEALALIAVTASMAIARSVQNFSADLT
jgi:hypothetical protein